MDKIDDLARKKEAALASGGETNIQMQYKLNKMTARERLAFLLDEGSFVEIGAMVSSNGAGVITGYGTINDRLVYIYSQDFTVDGGLINIKNSKKIVDIMDKALKMGAPLIQIIDSTGAKLEEGLDMLSGYAKIINMNAKLSGVVPQISVIAGPCTGLSAIGAAMSDITIIAESSGEIYVNSPGSIEESTRQFITRNMYADAGKSTENGSVQLAAADDKEALSLAKKLIGYLPSNNIEFTPVEISSQRGVSMDLNLDKMENIDIRQSIASIVDEDSAIEFDRNLSESVVTLMTKINGLSVGIVANNKRINEGRLDIKACEKITKFVKLCDSFNISLVTLVDTKGFVASIEEENNGLALSAAKMIYALSEANVPKVSIVTGEAYGAAYVGLASKETAFDAVYAWAGSKIAIAEPARLVKILRKEEIVSSEIPKKKEEEFIIEYTEKQASVYRAAEEGYVDDVIAPSETAAKLFLTLDMLQSKRVIKYPKKHGSILI